MRLSNFPKNHNALALFPQLEYLDNVYDSIFQRELISNIENNVLQLKYLDDVYDSNFQGELISNIKNNEDWQKFLLATSDIG